MARNRVIYQSEGVFVGQLAATGGNHASTDIKEAYRVQSANYSFNLARRDVNQYGELAAIDRVPLDAPTVSLDFTYLLANAYNESGVLGFTTDAAGNAGNAIGGILTGGVTSCRNYWIKTVGYGFDLHGLNTTGYAFGTIGFGNGYISSYTVDGAVGDFPRASVRVDASNIKFDSWLSTDTGSGTQIPAINTTDGTPVAGTYLLPSGQSTTSATDKTTVLRPGDITFTWGTYTSNDIGADIEDAKIQSFTLTTDIGRTPIQRLGLKYAYSNEINFPVNASLRVTAIVGDLGTGALSAFVDSTGTYNVGVTIKKPGTALTAFGATLKGVTLDSQEYSSSIGDNKTVTYTFAVPIGGPNDLNKGLFIYGMN